MNNQEFELTLLSIGQIWGNDFANQLEVLRKYGTKAAISDLCVLTGSYSAPTDYNVEDSSLDRSKRRTSWFWTASYYNDTAVCAVSMNLYKDLEHGDRRSGAVRPALESSLVYSQISPNKVRGYNDTYEVEYGEYPQYAASDRMQQILESELNRGLLNKTGRNYTFDSTKHNDYNTGFKGITYDEYEYQGRKFIRVKANSSYDGELFELSNGIKYRDGDFVWVEVSPVKWLVDDRTETLISKIGLVSGIRYLDKGTNYKGDFDKTEMKAYFDNYMSKDLFQSIVLPKVQDINYDQLPKDQQLKLKIENYLQIINNELLNNKYLEILKKYENNSHEIKKADVERRKNILLNNQITLTTKLLENYDSDTFYNLHVLELSTFLEKIEKSSDIFNVINGCEKIINGEIIKLSDELLKDIKTLKELYQNLGETLQTKNENLLKEYLSKEKESLVHSIIDEDSELSYSTVREWENHFRTILHALIMNFKEDYELDLLNKKASATKETISKLEKGTYDSLLLYIDTIRKSVEHIKSLITDKDEDIIEELKQYEKIEIDLSKSINENIDRIIELYNGVLKLEVKVEYIYNPLTR